MSYLSKIAARSALNNAPSLMPAMPFMAKGNTDPFQQGINTQTTFYPVSSGNAATDKQNESGKRADPLIQDGTKHTRSGTQGSRFEKTYITKHIERLVSGEGNTRQPGARPKSIITNDVAPETNTDPAKSMESRHSEKNAIGNKEPGSVNLKPNTEPGDKKATSAETERSLSEPSPVFKPIPEDKKVRNIENKTVTQKVAKLNPARPNPITPAAKGNKAMPKLVIGKISVEILPPVMSQPAKVITRVVQAPSFSESSKPNKLSFGLGQL